MGCPHSNIVHRTGHKTQNSWNFTTERQTRCPAFSGVTNLKSDFAVHTSLGHGHPVQNALWLDLRILKTTTKKKKKKKKKSLKTRTLKTVNGNLLEIFAYELHPRLHDVPQLSLKFPTIAHQTTSNIHLTLVKWEHHNGLACAQTPLSLLFVICACLGISFFSEEELLFFISKQISFFWIDAPKKAQLESARPTVHSASMHGSRVCSPRKWAVPVSRP